MLQLAKALRHLRLQFDVCAWDAWPTLLHTIGPHLLLHPVQVRGVCDPYQGGLAVLGTVHSPHPPLFQWCLPRHPCMNGSLFTLPPSLSWCVSVCCPLGAALRAHRRHCYMFLSACAVHACRRVCAVCPDGDAFHTLSRPCVGCSCTACALAACKPWGGCGFLQPTPSSPPQGVSAHRTVSAHLS